MRRRIAANGKNCQNWAKIAGIARHRRHRRQRIKLCNVWVGQAWFSNALKGELSDDGDDAR
jgi:hypothetical protein